MTGKKKVPNPGSDEAIKMGCKCPILDNCHGKGGESIFMTPGLFWINKNCPIHGEKK